MANNEWIEDVENPLELTLKDIEEACMLSCGSPTLQISSEEYNFMREYFGFKKKLLQHKDFIQYSFSGEKS